MGKYCNISLLKLNRDKEMQTPHHKAYEYNYTFVDHNGINCIARNYIAICHGVDIHSLVTRWNQISTNNQNYELVGEVDLKTALYARSPKGATIANDWKLLDHMQFHSVLIEIIEVK